MNMMMALKYLNVLEVMMSTKVAIYVLVEVDCFRPRTPSLFFPHFVAQQFFKEHKILKLQQSQLKQDGW